jgi:hypothetical protein
MSDITELYDYEIKIVNDLTMRIMHKYKEKPLTPENLIAMEKEIEGRFHDAGFVVECDTLDYVTRLLAGEEAYPIINVINRVTPIGEFDYDKKRHEIKLNG